MHIDVFSVLCAQLTRDLLAIAKFLFHSNIFVPSLGNTLARALNETGVIRK